MEAQNSSAETDEEWLAQNMDWIKKNAPDWLPPSKQKSDECYPDLNGLTFDSNFEVISIYITRYITLDRQILHPLRS